MAAQLQLRNCRNWSNLRQNRILSTSPFSEPKITGRCPHTAGSNARQTRLRPLSQPQPSKLPVRDVNKSGKQQNKPSASQGKSRIKSSLAQNKPNTKPIDNKKRSSQMNALTASSEAESLDPCIVAHDTQADAASSSGHTSPAKQLKQGPAITQNNLTDDSSLNLSSPHPTPSQGSTQTVTASDNDDPIESPVDAPSHPSAGTNRNSTHTNHIQGQP